MTTTPEQDRAARLAAFASAVRASPHNLLSKRALEELESRHIAESQAFASRLPAGAKLLDLGTGGGFPGMVVAICRPDIQVTLLDATTKKIAFLREFAADQGIAVDVLDGRAEELQHAHGRTFDIVSARAVAPLERLVGWALPFLRPGGELWAIKGARWKDELQDALPELRRHRAQVVSVPGVETSESGAPLEPRVVIIRAAG